MTNWLSAFKKKSELPRTALLLSVLALTAACSPGMFEGKSQDVDLGVRETKSYRKVNQACADLDLSSSEINVGTFKELLHCFNSNGSLEPIERLVNNLKDEQLEALVATSNKYVLNNPAVLYEVEKTFYALDDQHILDESLLQLGRLLENDEFVASAIGLLKDGYFAKSEATVGVAPHADKEILKVLELLSARLTNENVIDTLDLGLSLGGNKLLAALQEHFNGDSLRGRTLRQLTDQFTAYLQQTARPEHVELGRRALESLINDDLFVALDGAIGGTSDRNLKEGIPKMAAVLKASLANDASALDGLTSLFRYLHRPISCLKGTRTLPDATMYVMDELTAQPSSQASAFVERNNLLLMVVMNPFCDFPAELGQYYPSILELAKKRSMEPAADLLKAVHGIQRPDPNNPKKMRHPLTDLVLDAASDPSLKLLFPLLSELNDREVNGVSLWENLLLFANLPRLEDRQKLKDSLAYLIAPRAALQGRAIFDVASDSVVRASGDNLYKFVHSLRKFLDESNKDPLLVPSLTVLKQAFFTNEVHPILDLVRKVSAEATQNEKFFDTLFVVSDRPEFQESVALISKMARTGELKELLGAVITLFHKFGQQGKKQILGGIEPPENTVKLRHALTAKDLVPFIDGPALFAEGWGSLAACEKLDPRISMADPFTPQFASQLTNTLACVNVDGGHKDLVAAVNYLDNEKTDDGRSYLQMSIDWFKELNFTQNEAAYLTGSMLKTWDDGRLFRVLDAIPFLVNGSTRAGTGRIDSTGPVLRPLLNLLAPVLDAKVDSDSPPSFRELEKFGATVVRDSAVPGILSFVEKIWDKKAESEVTPEWTDARLVERMKRWVGNKECNSLASSPAQADLQKQARALEMVDDYRGSVTNWDLVQGKPRKAWTIDDLRGSVYEADNLIDKLADPKQSEPSRPALKGLLNVMNYFTLEPGQKPTQGKHFNREQLFDFLYDRSGDSDAKLITYYYKGDKTPRVRLVNTLDRLELVLIHADFPAPPPFNRIYAQQFLAEIGEAWGDEPREIWPDEIQKKFPLGGKARPETLAEALENIMKVQHKFEKIVGFPALPKCKQIADPSDPKSVQDAETTNPDDGGSIVPDWMPNAFGMDFEFLRANLYNIRQVISVLQENLPDSGSFRNPDRKHAGGLKILRDLFFEIYYSTPKAYRKSPGEAAALGIGWKNNLNIVMKMVRMGVTRQAGRAMRNVDRNDPSVRALFDALIDGATAPQALPLAEMVLDRDVSHTLIWKLVSQVFDVLDSKDSKKFSQTAFYGLALMGDRSQPFSPLLNPLLESLGPIVDQYWDFLNAHTDKISTLLRSERVSNLARVIYEDPDDISKGNLARLGADALADPVRGLQLMSLVQALEDTPGAMDAWDLFVSRWDAIQELPEFKKLDVDALAKQMLHFIEEKDLSLVERELALKVRFFVAQKMDVGQLDQFLLLARKDPNEFYRVLETLSRVIKNGEVKEFIGTARRALLQGTAN
ncbi:hypothetical protein WDW86_16250 [Bdellovibrionota bacterium FG-2]